MKASSPRTISLFTLVGFLFVCLHAPLAWAQSSLIGWGGTWFGAVENPPDLTNAVAVSSGYSFETYVLRVDGTALKLAGSSTGPSPLPADWTNLVAVAGGGNDHGVALRRDGTVSVCGTYWNGLTNVTLTPPEGLTNVVAIAAGRGHDIALRSNGTVLVWGEGVEHVPASFPTNLTNVIAIAAASFYDLALLANGTVVAWGTGPTNVPSDLTDVVAIAAGWQNHCMALKADHTVVVWGDNSLGQMNVPPGLTNCVAIAAGYGNCLALRTDGKIVAWGDQNCTNMPAELTGVTAIGTGDACMLALTGGAPFLMHSLVDRSAGIGETIRFRAEAGGGWPLSYQWRFNGANLPGATTDVLSLTNVQLSQAGAYSVVVSNTFGVTTSSNTLLAVAPIRISLQPRDQEAYIGGNAQFEVSAQGSPPLTYQWQKNGTNLPGATDRILALTNVGRADAGSYAVLVSDTLATNTSQTVFLAVVHVVGWGDSTFGQTNISPNLTNVLAIAAGEAHAVALKSDGTVTAWGFNGQNQTNVPTIFSRVAAIAAGGSHSLALKTNGTMTAWGRISLTNIPTSILNKGVAMAGGIGHSLALKSDGTVVTWGDPIISGGDVNAPPPPDVTNVVAVAAGAGFNLALTAAGIVRAWTPTPYFANVTNVPAGLSNVVAIAAGFRHALALKADGTVAAWGDNSSGQLGVPSGLANIVAIAAGDFHNLALKSNGTIVAWGDNSKGQLNIPTGVKNVAAIAAGGYFSLALIGDGPPVVRAAVANVTWQGNSLRSFWPSQNGRVYRLEYKNSLTDSLWIPLPLAPGNGAMMTLTDPTATGTQRFYRVLRW